jgi:FdhD protein
MQERPVQIIVNGRAAVTLMTAADDPLDLVTGHLYTERVIDAFSGIMSMHTDGPQVSVVTSNPLGILLSRKSVLAGCGGASSFLDSGRLQRISSELKIPERQIRDGLKKLPASDWIAGGLFEMDGSLLVSVSDLTSQNVLDRLIGRGLAEGFTPEACYVVIRGNVTDESVRKAVIAEIPCMAVAGEATGLARETAEEYGMKLVTVIPC